MEMNSWEFEQIPEEKQQGLEITHGWVKDFLEKISREKIEGFYPTGSTYFGLNNKRSDIDFIVKKETWNTLHKQASIFYGKCINIIDDEFGGWNRPKYEFESLKFIYKDRVFNFIIVPDEVEYRIWVQTTNTFMLLLENKIIKKIMKNKNNRIKMFEILKSIFRGYYERKK